MNGFPPAHHLPALPARAAIAIGAPKRDADWDENDAFDCDRQHLTAAKLRWKISHYHELRPTEEHDWYLWMRCTISGTISVDGHRFAFVDRPVNLLRTNWPDGQWRELGGHHSDNLADG